MKRRVVLFSGRIGTALSIAPIVGTNEQITCT